jgi:predicted tellurium resistance membrane protein TerC
VDVQLSDFVTIGLLVLLGPAQRTTPSSGRPRAGPAAQRQKKALRYGIVGAFAFRALATALAAYLIDVWVKLVVRRTCSTCHAHFAERPQEGQQRTFGRRGRGSADGVLGHRREGGFTDIVFAIDSILVAVAISNKLWVIITGGVLDIIARDADRQL